MYTCQIQHIVVCTVIQLLVDVKLKLKCTINIPILPSIVISQLCNCREIKLLLITLLYQGFNFNRIIE